MKTTRTIFMLFFMLLFLSASAFATQLSMPSTNGSAGAAVDIPVNIDNATGVAAFQFTVTYNASVLNCTTVDKGSLISAGWDAMTVNPQSGQIFGSSNSSDLSGLGNVSGSLAIIRCTAVGSNGASTPLQFTASPATAVVNSLGDPITTTLVNGSFTIGQGCVPSTEVCDGADNDCDGQIDEGIAPVATTCGVGACASTGQSTCVSGQMVDSCIAGTPGTEGPAGSASCSDSADNDCDGQVDSADTGCASAGAEVCDGVDNDGDSQIDEGIAPVATTCGVGACASTGQSSCVSGQMVDSCTPGTPGTEGPAGGASCSDNVDNDCDGLIDASDPNCVAEELPDMSAWIGQWFTVKVSTQCTTYDESLSRFSKQKFTEYAYIYIWKWEPSASAFGIDYYEKIGVTWSGYAQSLQFFAGSIPQFLFLYEDSNSYMETALNGEIKGVFKSGILKSAKLSTIGGFYMEEYENRYSSCKQTMTGSMISESKVKVPYEVRIQH